MAATLVLEVLAAPCPAPARPDAVGLVGPPPVLAAGAVVDATVAVRLPQAVPPVTILAAGVALGPRPAAADVGADPPPSGRLGPARAV